PKMAEMIYNGLWFTPLREALSAFITETQKKVTGSVRLKLYKGNVIVDGRTSTHSLYWEDLATFGADAVYNQHDAEGFINLYRLRCKLCSRDNKNESTVIYRIFRIRCSIGSLRYPGVHRACPDACPLPHHPDPRRQAHHPRS